MTTGEMFKFWFIYKVGVPVAVIAGIFLIGLIYILTVVYIIDPIKRWRKKRMVSATKRTERCYHCGEAVTDWVEPDGAKGRVCRACEPIFHSAGRSADNE